MRKASIIFKIKISINVHFTYVGSVRYCKQARWCIMRKRGAILQHDEWSNALAPPTFFVFAHARGSHMTTAYLNVKTTLHYA